MSPPHFSIARSPAKNPRFGLTSLVARIKSNDACIVYPPQEINQAAQTAAERETPRAQWIKQFRRGRFLWQTGVAGVAGISMLLLIIAKISIRRLETKFACDLSGRSQISWRTTSFLPNFRCSVSRVSATVAIIEEEDKIETTVHSSCSF